MLEDELKKPFPVEKLSWRVGNKNKDKTKANMLVYIDSRDVQDRLDEVCGVGGWQDHYESVGGRLICTLSILVDGVWVSKSDGAGDTDIEGEKGGISDAFKRAAVKFGIGRYLYNAKDFNTWVNCKDISDFDIYNKNKQQLDAVANSISRTVVPSLGKRIDSFKAFVSKSNLEVLESENFVTKYYALLSICDYCSGTDLVAHFEARVKELSKSEA